MVYPDSESPTVDPLDVQNDYLGIIVLGMGGGDRVMFKYILRVFYIRTRQDCQIVCEL